MFDLLKKVVPLPRFNIFFTCAILIKFLYPPWSIGIIHIYCMIGDVCKDLVDTDIVQVLLKHATNDNLQQDVKRNAVLCLARLATGNERYISSFSL